jgi:NAD-dependent SIR2 family protein deacetylase
MRDRPNHVIMHDGELRCRNCDNAVSEDGKWIDDDQNYGEDPDWCPDCNAKMKPIR